MLVLTRRVGEDLVIGGEIRVKVVAVKGNTVKLGITAPDDITVDRAEIHEQKVRSGQTKGVLVGV